MNLRKLKVTTIVGTRPEIIRLAAIIKKFDLLFEHRLIHTGQNSDPSLSDIFFEDLELRSPDLLFELPNESLGTFLGALFVAAEKEFLENRPDAILILGDTNSSLVALLAKRLQIPIYHLEAGNRSFDANVPEEINRKVIDHLSDVNMAYTQHAKANLIREGIHPRTISVIGSPLREVLREVAPKIQKTEVVRSLGLKPQGYFLVSLHRQENVDSPERLSLLIESLNMLCSVYSLPVLVSTHPRTKLRLAKSSKSIDPLINFHEPFGFIDYLALQKASKIVLSDSGSISEEAAIMGFSSITLRNSMERPEALESGSILMCGLSASEVHLAVEYQLANPQIPECPQDYLIENTSSRVANFLISTVHQLNFWNGIRPLYLKSE
jgi:UDP-N-acetylglucosamine 2-epimerase (non-hydrolysing)